ncbi:hypothetical protein ABIB95_009422, partial [Bradyrhizobium sp. LA2.1]
RTHHRMVFLAQSSSGCRSTRSCQIKKTTVMLMYAAGIRHVQPGIENLSSNVLRLMRKGITGARNAQALRDLEASSLTVSWNYLVGIPGETDDDYEKIIPQLPHLYHLQPPRAGATRVSIQRFSPFFNDPKLGVSTKRPHAAYPLIYRLEPQQLAQIAFFFESAPQGISDAMVGRLQAEIDKWIEAYNNGAQLVFNKTDDGVQIVDMRLFGDPRRTALRTPAELQLFRALRSVISRDGVCGIVARNAGCSVTDVELTLKRFLEAGWIFEDEGLLVGLPIDVSPNRSISSDTRARLCA